MRSFEERRIPTMRRSEKSGAVGCVSCEICIHACPTRALTLDRGATTAPTKFLLDLLACTGCGWCVHSCPVVALEMVAIEAAPARGGLGALKDLVV